MIEIILPYKKETPGTVVYAVKDALTVPVGQVYIRKDALTQTEGRWPASVKVAVEVLEEVPE